MDRQLFILPVILKQLCWYFWQNPHLCSLSLRLLQLPKDIVQHLRFPIVLLLNQLKDLNNLISDLQLLTLPIQSLFLTLFLKIPPLSINTLVKFIGQSQDLHSHIVFLTIINQQLEITFHL